MLVSAFSVLSELPLPGVCDLAGECRKEGWICWRFPVLPRVLMHTAVLALRLLLQQCQKRGPEIKARMMVSCHVKRIAISKEQGFSFPEEELLSQNRSDGKETTESLLWLTF